MKQGQIVTLTQRMKALGVKSFNVQDEKGTVSVELGPDYTPRPPTPPKKEV